MSVVLKGASSILVHTPDLVPLGSKPTREIPRFEGLGDECIAHLRSYRDAVAYPPNQVFIFETRTTFSRYTKRGWLMGVV